MSVKVIEPGRVVRVGPNVVDAYDILDYADALIETYGWNQGDRTNPPDVAYVESSEAVGYTLHDAIGAAGTKLFGDKNAHGIRQAAQAAVDKVLAEVAPGKTDMQFNDEAQAVSEIRAVLQRAMEEV